jgi:hypothetical protein
LLPLGCELDSAITLSTRMLILCNPSNPTGSVYSAEQLEALAEVKRSVLACHATWLQRHAAWLPRHGTWLQRGCRGTERGCSVVAAAWNVVAAWLPRHGTWFCFSLVGLQQRVWRIGAVTQ